MKAKRLTVVAFLLCAIMILGVGFAALTNVLDIQGTADVSQSAAESEFNEDIYFSEVSTYDANTAGEAKSYTASIVANNNDKATFTVTGLATKDDYATITFTIKSKSDRDAVVTPSVTTNTKAEYFAISSDWNSQPKDLAANSEIKISITVTLLQTPTETISGSFIIELTAVAG